MPLHTGVQNVKVEFHLSYPIEFHLSCLMEFHLSCPMEFHLYILIRVLTVIIDGIPSDSTGGIPLKTFLRKAIGNYRKLPDKYRCISSEKADIPPIITTINADKRVEWRRYLPMFDDGFPKFPPIIIGVSAEKFWLGRCSLCLLWFILKYLNLTYVWF